MFVFGKDFDITFYTYEDGNTFPIIPAQTISWHLYDSSVSRADAFAGSNSLKSGTESILENTEITFTVTAIDDPHNEDETEYKDYWIALVFKLATDEQSQLVIRKIRVYKVGAKHTQIGVTYEKIKDAYPEIDRFLEEDQTKEMIKLARIEVLADLKNKGYKWQLINDPEELFNALLFKSLFYVFNSQIQSANDKFEINSRWAHDAYTKVINSLSIRLETSRGEPIANEKTGGMVWLQR